MASTVALVRDESNRRVTAEREAAARRLDETRAQTSRQLQKERQVTGSVMQVLKELPPLQTAIELGDLRILEEELMKWSTDVLPERFGDCRGVVEAVVKLAQERLVTWR